MAVDYGRQIGFHKTALITAVLVINLVGFPATLAYGRLAERFGAKAGILFAIGVYGVTTILASFMTTTLHFYALAVVIGLVQGGIQALSRSFYSRIIPQDRSAEFFGFYNMLGKFAAVLGPIMVGWVSVLSGSPRLAILSIVVLFVAGAAILSRVTEPAAA
jgi:UMF1 family MFS transporter